MSPSAIRLYTFLCWKSDRRTSRMFKAKDSEATERCGAQSRSLTNARKELSQLGLILFERQPGEEYGYTLCDCRTGKPYPGNPAEKIEGEQRRKSSSSDYGLPDATPREQIEEAQPDDSDTDFKFGHNAGMDELSNEKASLLSQFNPFSNAKH